MSAAAQMTELTSASGPLRPATEIKPPPIKHQGVVRSLQMLRASWHEPITVGDLVAASALSRRGFIKAFARHTGTTPKLELTRLRLEHARRLLEETQLPTTLVATRCGYQSANSFLVAFKRENGLTPRQFRYRQT